MYSAEDKTLLKKLDVAEAPSIDGIEQPKNKKGEIIKVTQNPDILRENILGYSEISRKQEAEFSGNRSELQVIPSENTNIPMKRPLDESYESKDLQLKNISMDLRTEHVKKSRLMTEVEDPDTRCENGRQILSTISEYGDCQIPNIKQNIKFHWYYPTKTRKPIFPTKIKHLADGSVRRYLGRQLKSHIKTLIATQGRKITLVTKDVATNTSSSNTLKDQTQSQNSVPKENINNTVQQSVNQEVSEPKMESLETSKSVPSTSQNTQASTNQFLMSACDPNTVISTSVVPAPINVHKLGDNPKSQLSIEKDSSHQEHLKVEQRVKTQPQEINVSDKEQTPIKIISQFVIPGRNPDVEQPKKNNDINDIHSFQLPIANPQRPVNDDRNVIIETRQENIKQRHNMTNPPDINIDRQERNSQQPINIEREQRNIQPPHQINIGREDLDSEITSDLNDLPHAGGPHHRRPLYVYQNHSIPPYDLQPHSMPPYGLESRGLPPYGLQSHGYPPHDFRSYGYPPHGFRSHGYPPYSMQSYYPPYGMELRGYPPYGIDSRGYPPRDFIPPYGMESRSYPPYPSTQHLMPPQMWPMARNQQSNVERELANIVQEVIDRQEPNIAQQRAHITQQNMGQRRVPTVAPQQADNAMQNNDLRRQVNDNQSMNIAQLNMSESQQQRMVKQPANITPQQSIKRQLNTEPEPVVRLPQNFRKPPLNIPLATMYAKLHTALPQPPVNIPPLSMSEKNLLSEAQQLVNIPFHQIVEKPPQNLTQQSAGNSLSSLVEILPLNLSQQAVNIPPKQMLENLPLNQSQRAINSPSHQMVERMPANVESQTANMNQQPIVARFEQNIEQQGILAPANRPSAQPQQRPNIDQDIENTPLDDSRSLNYLRQLRESFETFQGLLLESVQLESPRNPDNDRSSESSGSRSESPVNSPPRDAEDGGLPPVLAHIRLQPLRYMQRRSNPNENQDQPNMLPMPPLPDWFEFMHNREDAWNFELE